MPSQRLSSRRPSALSRAITLLIICKILFLIVFWQLVLKHQAVRINTTLMSDRLVATESQGS